MSKVLTTSLPQGIISWLSAFSLENKVPKNKVICAALKMYQEYIEKKEMEKMFEDASSDNYLVDLAEEDLDDYLVQLNNLNL